MPIIRGAASDFTTFQKNSAQANAYTTWKYSRVGQLPAHMSITSAESLASRVSLRASSRTVASFNILTRGNATRYPFFLDPSKSKGMPGPRYFLD